MNDLHSRGGWSRDSGPQGARVWNHWLGGRDSYLHDREAAARLEERAPGTRTAARHHQACTMRATAHMAAQGIDQFLDIGVGLPVTGSTHQIVQNIHPGARVVYADNDPVVMAHARALLVGDRAGSVGHLDADLAQPDELLFNAADMLDFHRPVGIVLTGVMECILDHDQARRIVQRLIRTAPAGSCLLFTHLSAWSGRPGWRPPAADSLVAAWNKTVRPLITARAPEQIHGLLDGLELLGPGLAPCERWSLQPSPPPAPPAAPDQVQWLCALGRLPF
ncbi:hypothetical protein ACRB68_36630 [Actinomadura sp. RB68]|uniref:SAM-dependent methyltransferase n=2 Tax=Actinomadura macrotermitis TaxID=2585200 RepID=A0A7K0BWZ5_9ACTN|nr:hypothetical protein [Actinomadura macrotermitis]